MAERGQLSARTCRPWPPADHRHARGKGHSRTRSIRGARLRVLHPDHGRTRGGHPARDTRARGGGVRRAEVNRRTRETDIRVKITIEGRGRYDVSTGIRFFDHMLELVARHGAFDLTLEAQGDLDVDQH